MARHTIRTRREMVVEITAGHASLGQQGYQGQLEKPAQPEWAKEKLLRSLDGRADRLGRGKTIHGLSPQA
jgi:hypothetical protein